MFMTYFGNKFYDNIQSLRIASALSLPVPAVTHIDAQIKSNFMD